MIISHTKKPISVWLLIASLCTTQYLGLSFFTVALIAILREQGASLEQISSVYILGMIAACKVFWAPLVDKVRFTPKIGHYRGWLLCTQTILVILIFCISSFSIKTDFNTIYIFCILIALCGATQDIATDGLVCSLLTREERGFGNGIQTAGGMCGFMIGAGLVLMAYPYAGWQAAVLILAGSTSVSLVQLFFFKEPLFFTEVRDRLRVTTRLLGFWREKGNLRWLATIFIFPMGIAMAHAILIPLLVDHKWSIERIGIVVNIFGPAVGILSSLLSGWVILRFGRRTMLTCCFSFQIIGILSILYIAVGNMETIIVTIAIMSYFFCFMPTITLLSTFMMDRASKQSPATDYAIQYSSYQFFQMAISGITMIVASQIGYDGVMYAAVCIVVCMIFFVRYSITEK